MWKIGPEIVVRKSRFIGRAHTISSVEEGRLLIRRLKKDKDTKTASHHISALRVKLGSCSYIEESNDNGEPPAAKRILQILKNRNISNILVVVSRWYGGQKLGADRFRVIDNTAISAINAWEKGQETES